MKNLKGMAGVGSRSFLEKGCGLLCLLGVVAVRGQLDDADDRMPVFTGKPIQFKLFDDESWSMDVKLEWWSSSSDPSVEPQFYILMSVSRKPKADGSYSTLPVGSLAQTYIQITKRNEDQSEAYFNNYVGTHVIGEGESSPTEFKDRVYYDNDSCGTELLSVLDGLTFQGVEGTSTGCGYYMQRRE